MHIWISRFHFLDGSHAALFKSFGGGVAIGYVFVYMLPKLSSHQYFLAENIQGLEGLLAKDLYFVAVLGLLFYYGLMRAEVMYAAAGSSANQSSNERIISGLQNIGPVAYSVLIGYLLPNLPRPGIAPICLIVVVMVIHFTMLDHSLHNKQPVRYDALTRWLLTAGLLAGWVLGITLDLPRHIEAIWFAFLAGALILVVLREEIPDAQHGRFLPFVAGIVVFALLSNTIEKIFTVM